MKRPAAPPPPIAFDGETYDYPIDFRRMDTLSIRVWAFMVDNRWHYPAEMEDHFDNKHTWASISARARDFRKEKWNENLMLSEPRGKGLFRYQLIPRGSAYWHAMDPDERERLLEEQRNRRFYEKIAWVQERVEVAISFLRANNSSRALKVLEGIYHEE